MAARRRAVLPERREAVGSAVAALLRSSEAWRRAERVALYAALLDEVPTRPCFDVLRAEGRVPLLPRVESGRRLSFHPLERWEDLLPGRHGVSAPPEGAVATRLGEADLVLVPGVAFDASGYRLGRGGGFYDACFRSGEPAPALLGVAYEFQLVDDVPHGSHDRRMDAIVTEISIRQVSRTAR